MIRSILVPLDGSTFGEHALPLAMSMARRLDASLNLIHVHSLLDATYAELQVFDNTLDLAKEQAIQHMLIPLDGTPLAEQILEPALTLGKAMNADYTLLRVVTPVY